VFTRALHWSLSWTSSIQSIPSHPRRAAVEVSDPPPQGIYRLHSRK
jgi:hypothetical protein